jgi:hypothetical protein
LSLPLEPAYKVISCFQAFAFPNANLAPLQRVLFVDAATKRVGLTLRPHLLNPPATKAKDEVAGLPKAGTAYETAIVRRVDPSVGLLLELTPDSSATQTVGCMGYAHISDVVGLHKLNAVDPYL